jgi:hypothetical protein
MKRIYELQPGESLFQGKQFIYCIDRAMNCTLVIRSSPDHRDFYESHSSSGSIGYEACKFCDAVAKFQEELIRTEKFWRERLSHCRGMISESGEHYIAAPNKDRDFRGFGGAPFYIEVLGTGELFKCCNLWHQGEVPDFFVPMPTVRLHNPHSPECPFKFEQFAELPDSYQFRTLSEIES